MKLFPESLGGKVETLLPREALSAVLCSSLNVIQFRLKCCSYSNRFISFVLSFLREDCSSLVMLLSQDKMIHSGSSDLLKTFQLFRMEGYKVSHLESTCSASFGASSTRHQKLKFITTLILHHYGIVVKSNWNRGFGFADANAGHNESLACTILVSYPWYLVQQVKSSKWWPHCKKQNKKNTKAELFQSLRQGYFLWDPGDGVNINHMKQLVLPRGGLLFPINRFQEFQSCLGEQ